HSGREPGPAAAAQVRVLQRGDQVVGVHRQRLGQRPPAAAALVAVQGEGVRLVPGRGEDRGERVGHCCSLPTAGPGRGFAESAWETPDPAGPEPAVLPAPASRSASPETCSGSGAVQPCSWASFRPTRLAGPADGPSVAWPSLKPARIRDASRQVHSRLGPRLGLTGLPARRSSTSCREEAGVMLSKNSQLTITTGAESQAALHSTCSTETLPSGVASSWPTPTCSES